MRKSACTIWECLETGATQDDLINLFDTITDSQKVELQDFLTELQQCNLLDTAPTMRLQESKVQQAFESILFEKYDDMKELILLDPIHEVDARGWPHQKQ